MRNRFLILILLLAICPPSQAAAKKKKTLAEKVKAQSKIIRSDLKRVDPGEKNLSLSDISDSASTGTGARIGSLIKQISGSDAGSGASGAGGGAGGSSGSSGAGSQSGPQSTTFDDNAAKNGGGNSGGDVSGGGGTQNKPGKIEAYDKWFPACVFLSPNVGNGNEMIKGMVDMAAACKVNLVVFPFYVKGAPGSPQAVNDKARQSCNAIQGLGDQGVNRVASATVTGNARQAAQMCGVGNVDRDTCEEITYDPGETILQRYKMTGRGGKWNPTGTGIVGRNTKEALATTIFRQITGLPYGAGAGLGLGQWNEGDASAAGLKKKDGLNGFGCKALQDSSFPNDGRWRYNSGQETYIVKGEADRMFDLGKPIFTPPTPSMAGGQPPKSGGGGGGFGVQAQNGGGSGGGSNKPSGSGSSAGASSGGGTPTLEVAVGGSGHKKPPGGFGAAQAPETPLNGGTGAKTIAGKFGTGSDVGTANDVTRVGDAGGPKLSTGDASDVVKVGGRGPASVGGAGGAKTEYDDKANKVDTSISASQLNAASKGGSGVGGGSAATTLDTAYLKKTKAEEDAEAGAKLVASKRPRVLQEGDSPKLSTEYLKNLKIGQKTGRGKAYNGPVSNGEVTTLRRQVTR